jgi:hypothetical protein
MATATIKNTDNTLLSMIRGNYIVFRFNIKSGGTPLNLTGGTLYFTVKNHYNDTNAVLQKSNSTHDDPTNGESSIPVVEADTINLIVDKNYYYDFTYVDSGGKPITLIRGTFNLKFNVT